MQDARRTSEGLTGRHVLIAFIAFFGIVFAVNAYFMRVALSTHTGVVSNEPYRKGLKYNERIAADEQQSALGWSEVTELSSDGRRLRVTLKDRAGTPLRGLSLKATLGRPTTSVFDRSLDLVEAAAGHYVAVAELKDAGTYLVDLEVTDSGRSEILYRARKRLWLKP